MGARLRSKHGCHRCRIRRKKCDERKPICQNCARHCLICSWSADPNQIRERKPQYSNSGITPFVTRIPPSRILQGHKSQHSGYVPFRDYSQFWFSIQTARVYTQLIAKSADPIYHDTSYLVELAVQHASTRDALAGFSAYVLYNLNPTDSLLKQKALQHYQRALSATHEHITTCHDPMPGIDLLLTATFLGLLESLCTGEPEAARTHFLASAKICQVYRPQESWPRSHLIWYRIAVEAWLFNLATMALFFHDCAEVVQSIEWSVLTQAFRNMSPLDARCCSDSPLFGGNHDIYRLMLRLTWSVRRQQSWKCCKNQVSAWSKELDLLQSRLPTYFGLLPFGVATLSHNEFLLIIYGLRILLFKLDDPDLPSASLKIQHYIRSAQDLLMSTNVCESRNSMLEWPLIILVLAASDEKVLEFFATFVTKNHNSFYFGHQKLLHIVIEKARLRRKLGTDSLDLLVQPGGILEA